VGGGVRGFVLVVVLGAVVVVVVLVVVLGAVVVVVVLDVVVVVVTLLGAVVVVDVVDTLLGGGVVDVVVVVLSVVGIFVVVDDGIVVVVVVFIVVVVVFIPGLAVDVVVAIAPLYTKQTAFRAGFTSFGSVNQISQFLFRRLNWNSIPLHGGEELFLHSSLQAERSRTPILLYVLRPSRFPFPRRQ